MKRPLVPVALFYATGVLLGWWVPGPLPVLFAAAAAALAGAVFAKRSCPAFLAASLLLLGWANISLDGAVLSPFDLREVVGERTELASVRGHLLATPEARLSEDPAGVGAPRLRSQAVLRVVAIRRRAGWEPAAGHVLVTMTGAVDPAFYGDRAVEVFGVLRRPPVAVAPGLFDYRAYLGREGIHYQLQSAVPADWRLLDEAAPPRRPLADRFMAWATKVLEYDLPVSEPPGPGGLGDRPLDLLRAMTLGWKTPLTAGASLPFMRTGTMHVFAYMCRLHPYCHAPTMMLCALGTPFLRRAPGSHLSHLPISGQRGSGWQLP